MKTSVLFFGAILATSAMALPYGTVEKRINEQDVINSINAWINNVDNVNNFLDAAPGLDPQDLQSQAETALDNANDEPIQLQILSDVSGLDESGQQAANLLAEVFGNVPTQLQNIINDPGDSGVVQTALQVINNVRCLNVLPAVTALWAAAASASGAPPPPAAEIPQSCQGISKA
ncbi:hypothetical protein B7463_g5910, partial [Scytalidium lignicola]